VGCDRALAQELDADRPLWPRTDHHHRAMVVLQSVVAFVFMERTGTR